uniref:CRIB domain-containing protein n=1 Tax=Setaria viridis TaxID=4556 RepID=A0A4U6V2B9_SETVI|nr:hypothetical protein SEVIR_4G272900v2 [Setaria viridis]
MAISMKGIFRGLKIIAQIFTVQREHEIEIGYPTDVRHVSHVGFGASGSCPSWMNEFRGAEEVAAAGGGGGGASISSAVQSRQTSWASLGDARFGPGPSSVCCIRPKTNATTRAVASSFVFFFVARTRSLVRLLTRTLLRLLQTSSNR